MKKSIVMVAFAIATFAFVSCKGEAKEEETITETATEVMDEHAVHEHAHFVCPMDCEKGAVYENEGICPVCEMYLVEANQVPPAPENHEGHAHSEEGHEDHNH
jgi:hypothetical protein